MPLNEEFCIEFGRKIPFSRLFWPFENAEKNRVFPGADLEKPETRDLKIHSELETLLERPHLLIFVQQRVNFSTKPLFPAAILNILLAWNSTHFHITRS